jgi:N-acetylglucosamine-6-sulfatase
VAQPRPNVVVIETDDQTLESARVMSNVRSLIADQGATFRNSFVNYSLCCPSRSTFLTGEYAHHHRVFTNVAGFDRFQLLHGKNNLAVWLQRAGYYTALIGKYLNGNGARDQMFIPAGWSYWFGTTGLHKQAVYDYDVNDNGSLLHYGNDPSDYKDDVFTETAVDLIDGRAPRARPFFVWLTYTAPHVDPNPNPPAGCDDAAKPAPRHVDAFDSEPLPEPPNFNEADMADKPEEIQSLPRLDPAEIAEIARRYRCELESLLSVDDGVKRVIDELDNEGELDNTYVVFTSDNGFFHGEHRLPEEKERSYEESIRVPLVIRGPGVPRGVAVRDLAINADLAPTIVRVTGAEPGLVMDGRSLLPVARHPRRERGRELSIESRDFKGIRTERYLYAEHESGERELYDLKHDPYELQSVDADPAYRAVMRRLAARLGELRACEGRTCRRQPHLRLRLDYRQAREHGHRCARSPIVAELAGRNVGGVVKARFFAGREAVGADANAPFTHGLSRSSLDGYGLTRLRVSAAMLDGRRMTIDRHLRACA